MTEFEIIRVILSFLVGGAVVTGFTALTEKLGSHVGGLISGIPTTISVALFFQALILGVDVISSTCGLVLVAVGVFGAFCSGYIYFSKFGVPVGLIVAILIWFSFVLPLIYYPQDSYFIYFLLFSALAIFFITLMRYIKIEVPKILPRKKIPLWAYALRFVFSGTAIAIAVLLSLIGGAVLGGVFAAFPAMAISSIVILSVTMGKSFTRPYLRKTYQSSAINCALYITAVYFLYPTVGIYIGTLVAYLIVISMTYLILSRIN